MARTSPATFSTAATLSASAAAARSTRTTRAPSEAKRTAAARPMPPAPPVMSTTLPLNRGVMAGEHLALGADSTQAWGRDDRDRGAEGAHRDGRGGGDTRRGRAVGDVAPLRQRGRRCAPAGGHRGDGAPRSYRRRGYLRPCD